MSKVKENLEIEKYKIRINADMQYRSLIVNRIFQAVVFLLIAMGFVVVIVESPSSLPRLLVFFENILPTKSVWTIIFIISILANIMTFTTLLSMVKKYILSAK